MALSLNLSGTIAPKLFRTCSKHSFTTRFARHDLVITTSHAYLGFSGMSMLSPNTTIAPMVTTNMTALPTARHFGGTYSLGGGRGRKGIIIFADKEEAASAEVPS